MKSLCVNKNIIGIILKSEVCTVIICGSHKFEAGEELLVKEDCRIACIEEKEVDIRYRSDGLVRRISFTEREEANIFKDKLIGLLGVIGWVNGNSFPDEVARCKVRVLYSYSKKFSAISESEIYSTGLPKCRECNTCVMGCVDCLNESGSPYLRYLNKYNADYDNMMDFTSDVIILKLKLVERYF